MSSKAYEDKLRELRRCAPEELRKYLSFELASLGHFPVIEQLNAEQRKDLHARGVTIAALGWALAEQVKP